MRHILLLAISSLAPVTALAADVTVPVGGDIQGAIDQALPGETITLESGTHMTSELTTARDGEANSPITLVGQGEVVVELQGGDSRLLDVQHAYFHVNGITFDAAYTAGARVMRIDDGAVGFTMSNSEVRNATNHCIDVRATSDITIESSVIHHCLNWDNGRVDAHGITAGPVQGLTVRNTEIHSFTGDALQVDPGREAGGWDDVVLDGCTLWLGPINDGSGGVPAGVVPGENAIDTKTADGAVGTMTIRNTTAYGFRNGEISNMAAFNLKEDVEVIIDAVTVFDSEIAFRIRGRAGFGAQPTLTNVLIYDVDTALRLEDDLQATIPLWHTTFGRDIGQHVQTAGGADESILDVQNVVVLGAVPGELQGVSAVEADFENAAGDNYIPVDAAAWVDSGTELGVDHDRRGAMRPQGAGPDPGAFELGMAPAADMGFPPIADMGNSTPGNNDTPNNTPVNNNGTPNNEPGNNGPGSPDAGVVGDIGANFEGGEPDGCQCSSSPKPTSTSSWLLLIAILILRRRG